jgi:hypothetical protein
MGTWGTGLYASDFAADLRTTIRAVLRLPFEPDRLAEIVAATEPTAAANAADEDHSNFWLVLADQFARHGVRSDQVVEKTLEIIDSGRDLDMQAQLGQSASGLEKRRRVLADLRERIVASPAAGARKVLKAPQPFVMDVGDALIYPTCGGQCRNPYVAHLERLKIYGPNGGQVWTPDGWGALVIVTRGHTFGFFAWYRPVVVRRGWDHAPDLGMLRQGEWRLESPGTCSTTHFRRMGLEKAGRFDIDAGKLEGSFGPQGPGDAQAIRDISIANVMHVVASSSARPSASLLQQHAVPIGALIR